MKKLYIQTYGCQMNDHDSERMVGLLEPEGYRLSDRLEDADLVLMNTCSIRDKAEQKAFSELGRIKLVQQKRPSMIVGVVGCSARQHGKDILRRMPWVRLIFGSKQINQLPALLRQTVETGQPILSLEDPQGVAPTIPSRRKAGGTGLGFDYGGV